MTVVDCYLTTEEECNCVTLLKKMLIARDDVKSCMSLHRHGRQRVTLSYLLDHRDKHHREMS